MELKLSDLLDDLEAPDIPMNPCTVASASRIKELTMEKIEKTTPARKPVRRRFLTLLAAVLIIAALAGSVVAGHYYEGVFPNFFADRSGGDLLESQLALLTEGAVELNLSDTDGGYTVTLESAIFDGASMYLQCLITAPEGTVLGPGYYSFQDMDYAFPLREMKEGEYGGYGIQVDRIPDEDTTDNAVRMMLVIEGTHISTQVADPTWHFTFHGLMSRAGDDEWTYYATGSEWNFEFVLPETAEEIELVAEPITITGEFYKEDTSIPSGKYIEVSLTSFCLRSMGATMIYAFPEDVRPENLIFDPLNVVLTDGTVVEGKTAMASLDVDQIRHTLRFDLPVDLAEVAYVELPGGVKLYPTTE